MSQTLAAATQRRATGAVPRPTPTSKGGARAPRPTLRVVRAPAVDRGRTVFAVCCLLLLGGGLLSLLLVNTALAQGSFTLHDLQATSNELSDRQQALRQDIDVQAAPARLAKRAQALGMVPSGSPAFLRLSDGRVLGVARPAPRPKAPTVVASAPAAPQTATPQPSASPHGTAKATKSR